MATTKLSMKQQAFLEHYLGDDPDLHGNATRSYAKSYGCTTRSAAAAGERLLRNVEIQLQIAAFQAELQEKMKITAESVLQDSIRFRDIAFGDIGSIEERLVEDKATGEFSVQQFMVRRFNAQAVGKAIELMGRNCVVQAFTEKAEVSHVHYLEEVLNRRSKKVEAAAEARRLRLVKDDPENISL